MVSYWVDKAEASIPAASLMAEAKQVRYQATGQPAPELVWGWLCKLYL